MTPLRPEDDPSWSSYPSTVLELGGPPDPLRVDLRVPVSEQTRAALAGRDLRGPFAVLTAANPRGQQSSEELNEFLDARLRRLLSRLGCDSTRADGCSPDGLHREIGYAAALPRTMAETIARRYGQSAFFWFDGEAFWIVGGLVCTPPLRLPTNPQPAESGP